MPLSLPFPSSPQDGDAFLSGPVRQNIQAIAQAIQSFDGSQTQARSIQAAALALNADPITRGGETLGNFIASGCVWSAGAGLTANMTAGVLYVNGNRVSVLSVTAKSLTLNSDTYVDIDALGNITYIPVANNGASPTVTGNSVRVAKLVTNATVVTLVVASGMDSNYKAIGSLSPINLISNIFGNSIQTYTATGAGFPSSTGYYINLGNIKLCWGTASSTIAVVGAGFQFTNFAISLPTGFFTSLQAVQMSVANVTATQYISVTGNGQTNNILNGFVVQTNGTSGSAAPTWFVIGN